MGSTHSKTRLELLHWFRENAPSLAPAYEGAIRLLSDLDFPGRIHFIAHAFRDIADRLPFVLNPGLGGERIQYHSYLDAIKPVWPKTENLFALSAENNSATVPLPLGVVRQIDELVKVHPDNETRSSNYNSIFSSLISDDPQFASIRDRVVHDYKKTTSFFRSKAHLQAKLSICTESELVHNCESFERILHSFVGNYFTGMEEINEILQQANSSDC